MYIQGNTSGLELKNSTFENNCANSGGAIGINFQNVTITDCEFVDNIANFGGIFYSDSLLTSLTFEGNTISSYFSSTTSVKAVAGFDPCTMKGAFLYVPSGMSVTIASITIADVIIPGMGLFYIANGGTLNLVKSTITGSNTNAGIVYNLGTTNIDNINIYGCIGGYIGPLYCGGNGAMYIKNIDTRYNEDRGNNLNFYGGNIACGLIKVDGAELTLPYTLDGVSKSMALTTEGGTVEIEYGCIKGPDDKNDPEYAYCVKTGGGVYVGESATFTLKTGNINGNPYQQLYVANKGIANVYGDYKYNYVTKTIEGGKSYAKIGNSWGGNGLTVATGGRLNLLGGAVYKLVVDSEATLIVNGGEIENANFNKDSQIKINNAYIWQNYWDYCHFYIGTNAEVEFNQCLIKVDVYKRSTEYGNDQYVFQVNGGYAKFTDCVFQDCKSRGVYSGSNTQVPSLFKNYGGTFIFEGCEFLGNQGILFYTHPDYSASEYSFRNCTIDNLTYGGFAYDCWAMLYNGNFEMYNTTMTNINNTAFNSQNSTNFVMDGCTISNCTNGKWAGLFQLYNSTSSISNTTIEDCSATNAFGVLFCAGDVTLENSTIRNNSVSGVGQTTPNTEAGRGGGIYVNNGTLTLKGTVRVENNKTVLTTDFLDSLKTYESGKYARTTSDPSGGGIYVAGKLSVVSGAMIVCKNNVRQVEQADGTYVDYADNLYIAGSKNVLQGDLKTGTDVGLSASTSDDFEQDAILSIDSNTPVTNVLLGFFSCDNNNNYGLRFIAETGGRNGLVFYNKTQKDGFWVVGNDTVVDYDPLVSQSVDENIILMTGSSVYSGQYKVVYAETEDDLINDNCTEDPPTYRDRDSYTVYFKVLIRDENDAWTDDLRSQGDSEKKLVTGKLYLHILGTRMFVESYPNAWVGYGKTLQEAIFFQGKVVDARGYAVAGTWMFDDTTIKAKDGEGYSATFRPANEINLISSSKTALKCTVKVSTLYTYIFYQNGKFRAELDGNYTTEIGVADLQDAVDLLEDGGTLVFCEEYPIASQQIVNAGNKMVTFTRYRLFKKSIDSSGNYVDTGTPMAMFDIDGTNAFLTLSGNIYIDGLVPYSGWWNFDNNNDKDDVSHIKNYAVFEVGKTTGGTLTLGSGVVIRNWALKIDNENVGLITIYNKGSVVLDGCEIYGNKMIVKEALNSSVITNNGTLTISSGVFMNNILVSGTAYESNRTSANTTTPFGNGGFLVCTANSTTVMNGGSILCNKSQKGGAIYVLEGATLNLKGGEIFGNRAYTSGGAIYVNGTANITYSIACQIYGNLTGTNDASFVFETQQNVEDILTVSSSTSSTTTGVSATQVLQQIEEQNMVNINFEEIDKVEEKEDTQPVDDDKVAGQNKGNRVAKIDGTDNQNNGTSDYPVDITILLFIAFCLAFVCIIVRRKNIKK